MSYAGGLFDAGELLLAPFRAELARRRPRSARRRLDGAALLERPPLFASLVHEAGAPMTRLGHLSTEAARAERAEIDRLPTAELVRLMNDDDADRARGGRGGAVPAIVAAIDAIAERLARAGG